MINHPALKWVGGKNKLASTIFEYFPKTCKSYWEPFVGGAAMALNVFDNTNATINLSDINLDLILFYQDLRNNFDPLISRLQELKESFNATEDKSTAYIELRSKFQISIDIERSALFYFLNKTCFNGVVRYNRKGEFNQAFGKRDFNYDPELLEWFAQFLKSPKVSITHGDFESIQPSAGDVVYLDPPYHEISETSNFTLYNKIAWNNDSELRLAEKCNEWNQNGIKFILSNNDVPFITDLFSKYNIVRLDTVRIVAAKKTSRSRLQEVLIYN